MVIEEETWLKPSKNWDPKLVWVLRSFLANQKKWDTPETNRSRSHRFAYWSPRFYVVVGDELVATDTGVNGWSGTIAPLLKQLTGI